MVEWAAQAHRVVRAVAAVDADRANRERDSVFGAWHAPRPFPKILEAIMKRKMRFFWTLGGAALILILGTAFSVASGQSASSQTAPAVTPEQQKQLDQLRQLEDQLQKDRNALHQSIAQNGWDSEQTDAAQDQLIRDRMEYRKLRRSLRSAGIPVPPSSAMGAGTWGNGPGPRAGDMRRGAHRGHRCADCACPCCN